jgi:hypothetical protein
MPFGNQKGNRRMHSNDKNSESDEDDPTPESNAKRMYKCGNTECANAHRPELPAYMYNLACNYRTVTDASLLPLIRCRYCAEVIARQNEREIGDQGCGVYPLTLTLRMMKRREDDPIPAGVTTYECMVSGCGIRRRPEDMYNLGIGRAPETLDMVLPQIRCGHHARAVAATQGKEPCMPGSNVYRLSHTLRWVKDANKGT